MGKAKRYEPTARPRVTQRTDYSLPSSDCDCPPWEMCEHIKQPHDEMNEVTVEQWQFLKSIE
jgi:hypothetical protein